MIDPISLPIYQTDTYYNKWFYYQEYYHMQNSENVEHD